MNYKGEEKELKKPRLNEITTGLQLKTSVKNLDSSVGLLLLAENNPKLTTQPHTHTQELVNGAQILENCP